MRAGALHRLGLLFVLASALLFSLSGVLTKAIRADAWTILCWRGLIGGVAIVAWVRWRRRDRPWREALHLGPAGAILACEGAIASITFVWAFKLTYVANVAVIYATVPFLAASLGWLIAREALDRATLAAAFISLIGVLFVVSGGQGSGHLLGDAVALLMSVLNALYIVLIRRLREAPAVLAGGVSALLLVPLGILGAEPLAISGREMLILALFGLVFAAANILWTEGTRLVAASESALIGTAETPFAIALAWIVLAELPPLASLAGGALVTAAVLGHIRITQRPGDRT